MRVLVTGSRTWTDPLSVGAALSDITAKRDGVVIVHGGARGADQYAADWARRHGAAVEEHLAEWERYGRSAGMVRNAEMVAIGADVCVAFIRGGSPGATACADMARRAGISVVAITWERRTEELPR